MATYKAVDADKLDTDLKAIADSIRAKGGTTENLNFPADFVSAVGNIETGGGAKEEQEKTIEITANGTTEVVADEGKSMSKVTVNTNVAFIQSSNKETIVRFHCILPVDEADSAS